MAVLAWLLIPVVAAVVGVLWASWSTRQRSAVGDAAGVAGYERFREAMDRFQTDGRGGGRTAGPEPAVAHATDGSARAAD